MSLAAKDTSGARSCAGLRFDTFPVFAGVFVVIAMTLLVLAGIQSARFRSAERNEARDQAVTIREEPVTGSFVVRPDRVRDTASRDDGVPSKRLSGGGVARRQPVLPVAGTGLVAVKVGAKAAGRELDSEICDDTPVLTTPGH